MIEADLYIKTKRITVHKKMMRNILCLTIAAMCWNVTQACGQSRTEKIAWLSEHAYDLRTSNPEEPIAKASLDSIFQNIDLVLAGEANHGTKEFAQIRHRLFRYLVENLGFKYFLVEVDFAASLAVDDYICQGKGDSVQIIKELGYFHIVNQEGFELIQWMKSYNKGKPKNDQIRFFGVDCQKSEAALNRLKAFFQLVDPYYYKSIKDLALRYEEPDYRIGSLHEKYAPRTLTVPLIDSLKEQLLFHKEKYKSASSELEFSIAMRLVESLRQANTIYHSNSIQVREVFMADNTKWILKELGDGQKKAFLWAHNLHVSYDTIIQAATNKSVGTLGRMLKETYKEKAYSIATDFNLGTFVVTKIAIDSLSKATVTVDAAPDYTFSSLLAEIGKEVLFIDFRSIGEQNIPEWLKNNRQLLHDSGATFIPTQQFRGYRLIKNFDGIIFVNHIQGVNLNIK